MALKLSTGLRNQLLGRAGATPATGDGLAGILHLGFIAIYSGAQPTSADDAATGTLLGTVSVNAAGTGLTFDAQTDGEVSKAAAETWKMVGVAAGTAGWFRFYEAGGNPANASSTEARIDGSIATTGGDMQMSNVNVTSGSPHTIDVFKLTMPAF